MTNKEALVATLQTSVPDNSLEKALADRGIASSGTYGPTYTADVEKAAMDLLWGIISQPDVSEGGYSIRYDRAAIIKRLLFLANKYDDAVIIAELQPTVSSPKVW